RIPDMAVVRFMLADASNAESGRQSAPTAARGWTTTVPWAVAGGLAAALLLVLLLPSTKTAPPARPVTRFTIAPPDALLSAATSSGPIALSPDGTRLAYVAQSDTGTRLLYVREMDRLESRPLHETEEQTGVTSAGYPFFSPDGNWIGYVADSAVRKVPVGGGPVATVCTFEGAWRGATWLPDDTIVFGLELQKRNGLFRVPAHGGTPEPVVEVEQNELAYRWPDALPGGKAVIFSSQRGGDANAASIELVRLDTKERRVLVEGGSYPRYVAGGHIVFARAGVLMAAPFDLAALATTGAPAPVVPRVTMATTTGQAQYTVSASGTLAFASGDESGVNLVWVDRQGVVQPIPVAPQNFEHPRLSPDGQRLAVDIRGYNNSANTDIWIYQFARNTLSRLTFGPTENEAPVWTPDGTRVTYATTLADRPPRAIQSRLADNSGGEETLARGMEHLHPLQWNARGDVLLLNESAAASSDTFGLFMNEQRTIRPLAKTPYKEASAAFSPDGRWLAYASDETGRFEIYAQAFPGPGGKSQISAAGGVEPVWARSGKELFFRDGDKLMAVPVDIGGASVTAGAPRVLFQGRFVPSTSVDRWYDVSPDAQRFLMMRADSGRGAPTVTIVQEWGTELKRLVDAKP
ncbi:MAG TPA: hypothetical protein VEU08_09790, partial [Vicinamibacterales bacterium]|nr:hypothetical protein [Vicinamibacterales bacterium]